MNIFYLDSDVEICAQYHCDKHIIKMILESAQVLCTVLWMHNIPAPYRATHRHHPCVLWVNESLANWSWLVELAAALNKEYRYRFNHHINHKSYDVIRSLPLPPLADLGITPRPQVLPEEFKQRDPVQAYRAYYRDRKRSIARWTKRPIPEWFLS